MSDKPYRLPDPKVNPDSFLVILYKTCKKVPFNDRAWDKHYFARCMKRTQELLETFNGDVVLAAQCMQELKDRFIADGTHWTIETIVQYSFEWRSEHSKVNDRDCLRDLVGAYRSAGMETAALKPPEEEKSLHVLPACSHAGWPREKGKEWTCECGEKLYTPTEGEFQTVRSAFAGKKMP